MEPRENPRDSAPGVRRAFASRDTQVDPANADRLEQMARARKNGGPVSVVKVEGVNHLLVPAVSGEVDEYASLKDKTVSPNVVSAIANWLKSQPAAR